MTPSPAETPVPGLDPVAARRWLRRKRDVSPWLHEEVARRMIERLQWFRDAPASWLHWEPTIGGIDAHRAIAERLQGARAFVWTHDRKVPTALLVPQAPGIWGKMPWRQKSDGPALADAGTEVEMLWANLALHEIALPQELLRQWHRQVAPGGFLMFTCLGPDSLLELRRVYDRQAWPAPTHQFTDMHDWGDMLVHSGFAEPVMDMERITLTYSSASAMLDELRGVGRNLSMRRFAGLRGRGWRQCLEQAIEQQGARSADGRLALTFEIIYGHAFKAEPRTPSDGTQTVSVEEMRAMLRGRKS